MERERGGADLQSECCKNRRRRRRSEDRGIRGDASGCFSCNLFKESRVLQIQEKDILLKKTKQQREGKLH